MDKIVIGMGFGDEGKGTMVDYLTKMEVYNHNSVTVVRYCGGHQAGHQVVLPNGQSHIFSQFGSGTFHGAKTYHSRDSMFEPLAFNRERNSLLSHGWNPHISFHPKCLVTTPLHKYMNQLTRTIGGWNDTCGVGIGETRKYRLKYGNDAVLVEDLDSDDLVEKLHLMKDRYADETSYGELSESISCDKNKQSIQTILDLILSFIPETYISQINDVYYPACSTEPWPADTLIYESTQGMLLDEHFGTKPDVTWASLTPNKAIQLNYSKDFEIVGVIRNHFSRHGDGIFTPNDKVRPLNDHNHYNVNQGNIRYGRNDENKHFIKHAVDAIKATSYGYPINWAVTHCDYDAAGYDEEFLHSFFPIKYKSFGQTWKDKKEISI